MKNKVVLLFILFTLNGMAQLNYNFTAVSGSSGTYVANTTPIIVHGQGVDDALSGSIGIGFNFDFDSQTYSQFKISSNGFISLGTTNTDSFYINSLAGIHLDPIIAPLWDDLRCDNTTAASRTYCNYKMTGIAPNRVMTIEWSRSRWDLTSSNNVISFQCKLYETTNIIEFVYLQGANPVVSGGASIGIAGINSGFISLNNSSSAPTVSSTIETNTISTRPANNQIYRFTPIIPISVSSTVPTICAGSSTTLTATSTAPYSYSWSPTTGLNTTTGATIIASPSTTTTYTVTGVNGSNSATKTITVTVQPAPTDVFASPETIALCTNNPQVQVLTATGGLISGNVTVGSGTISPSEFTYTNPFSSYYGGVKHQMIYDASELIAEGLVSGNITTVSFQLSNFVASSCNNLTIRMKHTTATTLNAFQSGTTQVYTTASFVPSTTGWVTFTLNTPFVWNGTDNLLVEIVHNAENFGNGTGTRTYCTTTAVNKTFYGAKDNVAGGIIGFDALTAWDISGASTDRPNAQFGFPQEKVIWSPNTNLYTDLACTIPYDGISHAALLYANPTSSIVYTATATSGGCSKFDTVSFAPLSVVYNPSLYAANTPANWSSAPNANTAIVIEGNLTSTTDIEACSCTINSGDVIFESGATLALINELSVNGGSITFEDDASLVQVNDSAVNSGNITYKRVTTDNTPSSIDYVYWSSPTSSASTAANYCYYWNTTATNTTGGQGTWLAANNTAMQPGQGYIMRDIFAKNFTGVPFNGIIQPIVKRGANASLYDDNWNLIGNPYPSALNINKFLTDNTNIEGSIAMWTHGSAISSANNNPFYGSYTYNFSTNDYIIYNGTGTTSGPVGFNGYIAAGQGFFVKLLESGASTQNVTFNNSLRNKSFDNSQFYRQNVFSSSEPELNRIWLDIVNSNQLASRTLIGYLNGATNGNDRLFDATTSTTAEQKIYSLINNNKFAIQGRALPFDVLDTVPLGVDIPASGNYTISIHALEGVFNTTQDVFLEDLLLNTIHNLKLNPYAFSASTGSITNRFILRFTNETLSNDDSYIANENDIWITTNQLLQVHSSNQEISNIKVFDMLGKQISSILTDNCKTIAITSVNKTNSALIIYVTLKNGVVVHKKIIY
ncbi:MAG: hypothetical protein ACH34V_00035 [Flavobacterium sp.]|uniref:hypothetical protein n=1 Tax=Flavobacterium sp. TaxID=239 RepID=UPI003790CD58